MNDSQSRIELEIDIFEITSQAAQALAALTPPELVAAVLGEFRPELPYLGENAAGYQLLRVADGSALDDERPIARQCAPKTHLSLAERVPALPEGARALGGHAYLRDQSTGAVYPLHWQPALIGRPDATLADNAWLAVDLSAHPHRTRVSRRHAHVVAEHGHFYLESLAPNNPVVVEDTAGSRLTLDTARYMLHHGDSIWLGRGAVRLTFLERAEPRPPAV